ncbi:MAG: hypothetical protein KKF16_02115 [Euryarchaeota archaeon]|nr:hypothetical protein [Euryarchaeota archaeon]MBU4608076.1 hypothetical protein [Euryarchaeota archaeon]MBV1755726.1 hypothetical protein [Methanobacterium sp.]MBV1766852.1 hypothetical protein [Methanobacterium sp.]
MKEKSILLVIIVIVAILGSFAFAMTIISNEDTDNPMKSNNSSENNISIYNSSPSNTTLNNVPNSKSSANVSTQKPPIPGDNTGKVCPDCNSGKVICNACSGSGGYRDDGKWVRCSSCGGTGGKHCTRCGGDGRL